MRWLNSLHCRRHAEEDGRLLSFVHGVVARAENYPITFLPLCRPYLLVDSRDGADDEDEVVPLRQRNCQNWTEEWA